MELIRGVAGRAPTLTAVRVAMGVEAVFLETALAAIDRDFGGVDAYLAGPLGVDSSKRERLERSLLA